MKNILLISTFAVFFLTTEETQANQPKQNYFSDKAILTTPIILRPEEFKLKPTKLQKFGLKAKACGSFKKHSYYRKIRG